MTAERLLELLEDGAVLVVDVRHPLEFRAGHIPGAVNIPFWQSGRLAERVRCEGPTMVLVCEHGPRAWLAARMVRSVARREIRLLTGHMRGWKKAGLPLQRNAESGKKE